MPKEQENELVLHEWMGKLTFQMQAALLTSLRGPDNTKAETTAKALTRYIRGVVLKPAGVIHLHFNDNSFMWGKYEDFPTYAKGFLQDHDEYPQHFIMHLLHSAQIIGFHHPDKEISSHWWVFYKNLCKCFHLNPETKEQMDLRLNDFK